MGYALVGAEGIVSAWGATGFYADLLSKISPNRATITAVGDKIETTGLGAAVGRFLPGLGSWSGNIAARAFAVPRLGNVGLVSWSAGGYALHVESWELTIESAVHDITSLNSVAAPQWRAKRPDYIKASGSFQARIDSETPIANLHLPPTTGTATALPTLTLRYGADTAANAMAMTAIIEQVQPTLAQGSLSTVGYTFQGTGAITPSGTNSLFGTTAIEMPLWSEGGSSANTEIELEATDGLTYSGDAFWTRLNLRCAVGSPPELNIDFQGTGALAFA